MRLTPSSPAERLVNIIVISLLSYVCFTYSLWEIGFVGVAIVGYNIYDQLRERREHKLNCGNEPDDGVLGTHWSKLTRKMAEKKSGWE